MKEIPTWRCVVAAALQAGDGRWLMARRPPDKHHGGLWEFPGGKVEPGETPVNALVRELAEELGIAVLPGNLRPAAFAESSQEPGAAATVILLYTVTRWQGEPKAREPGAGIGWFAAADIAKLARPPLDVELCRSQLGLTPPVGGG